MGRAKEIQVKVIPSNIANEFVKKYHYSGKVVANSTLHFGAFLDGKLHGVLSYGSPMMKKKVLHLVEGTGWNEMLELNRMVFDDYLPRNSESRVISITIRMIKKNAPHIKWLLTYADGTQCGDGTIYRAAGFKLTNIKTNVGQRIDEKTGEVFSRMTFDAHRPNQKEYFNSLKVLDGNMFRYIYLIDPNCKLNTDVLPFSTIDEQDGGMYKGEKIPIKKRKLAKVA